MLIWYAAQRDKTFHCQLPDGSGQLALSFEQDGWYWGAFSYATGLRISDKPKPYETQEQARQAAEAWFWSHVKWEGPLN